jgi:hypothetical protein
MFQRAFLIPLLFLSAPALAESDEINPVPTAAVIGHPYFGDQAPSQIRFINVRDRSVRLMWISFDGTERPYAVIAPGHEIIQPTFVAHRWLVKDDDGTPLQAFISTRSAIRDNGIAQIALIR